MDLVSKSSISLMKPSTLIPCQQLRSTWLDVINRQYYFLIKGQRTIISQIHERLEAEVATGGNNFPAKQAILMHISNIMNCNYSDLYQVTNQAISALQSILWIPTLSSPIEKAAQTLLSAAVSLNALTKVRKEGQTPGEQFIKKCDESSNYDELDTVVCRICEMRIPVSKISDHTNACVEQYKSVAHLQEIETQLRDAINQVNMEFLNEKWPGSQEMAVAMYLPILRISFLAEQCVLVDPRLADGIEQMTDLVSALDYPEAMLQNPCIAKALSKIKPLFYEKLKISNALSSMPKIMSKFSSAALNQPQLSSFEFIKRISAGANARVFLARKMRTGDIYAIKVLPKKSLQLKNQTKRVLAERDILLKYNNPYIVKFCMF